MTAPSTRSDQDQGLIGIVVVNYASSELVRANLGSLHVGQSRTVLVDNFSGQQERTAARLLADELGWAFVAMDGNAGFASGVNAGVLVAENLGCSRFLLVNPDVKVTEETVDALRAASLRDELALVSPRLVSESGRLVFAGSRLDLRDGRIHGLRSRCSGAASSSMMPWLTAACLVVPLELWRRAGGFDERYFMYWEDVDFNFRCLAAGGHVMLRDDLVAVHDQGGTQGPRRGRAKSGLYYYYNCRNRVLFAIHNLCRGDIMGWLLRSPSVGYEIFLQGGRRQVLESPWLVTAPVRGTCAGVLLGLRAALLRAPAERHVAADLVTHARRPYSRIRGTMRSKNRNGC